jgi:hypothetical protein
LVIIYFVHTIASGIGPAVGSGFCPDLHKSFA